MAYSFSFHNQVGDFGLKSEQWVLLPNLLKYYDIDSSIKNLMINITFSLTSKIAFHDFERIKDPL